LRSAASTIPDSCKPFHKSKSFPIVFCRTFHTCNEDLDFRLLWRISGHAEKSGMNTFKLLPKILILVSLSQFAFAGPYTQQVVGLVDNSACGRTAWKSRGKAPAGYMRGVTLSFARSLCRTKMSPPSGLALILEAGNSGNAKKDALAHYQSIFTTAGIHTGTAGEESLKAIYTLGYGLGMRESSGKYCEGWDTSAGSNRPSSEGEAGVFQASYNSMAASPELRKLYEEYQKNPQRCLLDVFKTGTSCKAQSVLGAGAGAAYQAFNKACPAFATEYAMTLLRILRAHFGPINRQEAQVIPACNSLLTSVQQVIDADPEGACGEIY
jgi:hypothetical protein